MERTKSDANRRQWYRLSSKQLCNGSYCLLLEIVLRSKANTSDQQKKAPGRERGAKKPSLSSTINWSRQLRFDMSLSSLPTAKNFYGTTGLVSLRDMESAAEGLPPFQGQFNIYLYTLARGPSQKLNERCPKDKKSPESRD
ncbi:hypothetical protein GB937_006952 [Aspergillus fischeri]|nr:hypothetical protein GB937_006952 [Aspergillus fischeri]